MDPEAALVKAFEQLRGEGGDREDCAWTLRGYFEWRLKGGFEPHQGDERALRCLTRLGAVADTFREALEFSRENA